jgi:hypothetical protein
MKRLALVALCLMALATLTACVNFYDRATFPEARFDPGDQ